MIRLFALASSTLAVLALASCGMVEQTPLLAASETDCQAGAAEIRVTDGFLQRDCGCAEGGKGVAVFSPDELKCTVPAGTTVFFHYVATTHLHQIIPAREDRQFPASPLSNPKDGSSMVRDHAVEFTIPGSYPFIDAHGVMTGTIIVQ